MDNFKHVRRLAIAAAISVASSGCVTGRCDGGFRALIASGGSPTEPVGPTPIAATDFFWINVDHRAPTEADLLTDAGISAETFFLAGPTGVIPATLTVEPVAHPHSCASAASIRLHPNATLPPGTYDLVVLLDRTHWPLVGPAEATAWRGLRALTRPFVVR